MNNTNNHLTFLQLKNNIDNWAQEKGIHDKGSCFSQLMKTYEEIGELIQATQQEDKEAIIDAIGDILVTLINADWFVKETTIVGFFEVARDQFNINDKGISDRDKVTGKYSEKEILKEVQTKMAHLFEWVLFKSENVDFVKMYGTFVIIMMYNLFKYCDNIGVSPEECLNSAYNVISKRTGKMDANGVFVKDK